MANIPDEIIDRVRDSVDIVEVISRYVSLKKRGRNFVGLCPFHTEKTPSFTANQEKQIFHCFGCGAGGNVYRFLMRHENMSFVDSVRQLAAESGIKIPESGVDKRKASESEKLFNANLVAASYFERCLSEAPAEVQEYLEKRGLKQEITAKYKLGLAPDAWDGLLKHVAHYKYPLKPFEQLGLFLESSKTGNNYDRFRNRLIFPIHDVSGHIAGFGGRDMGDKKDTPKYLNSPESPVYQKSHVLYGLYFAREAIRERGSIICVEGYMDVLQLAQAGLQNTVATSGTALTESHGRLIKRYTNRVYLCYDADSAGVKAAVRGGETLFQQLLDVYVVQLPGGEDPDSFVKDKGVEAFEAELDKAAEYWQFRIDYLGNTYNTERAAERAAAVADLIQLLSQMNDNIRATFYAEQAAEFFGVPLAVFQDELQRVRKNAAKRARPTTSPQKTAENNANKAPTGNETLVFTGAWGGEKDIILLLINFFADIHEFVFEHLGSTDFLNPEFRNLFEAIRASGVDHQDHLLHFVLERISSEQLSGLILREIEHSNREFQKPALYLQGCVKQIKLARYQAEIDLARRTLKELTPSDENYMDELNKLQASMKELKTWQSVVIEDE